MIESTLWLIEKELSPKLKKDLEEVNKRLQSDAILTALGYLGFKCGGESVRESPVELADIIAGVFLNDVDWICRSNDNDSSEKTRKCAKYLGIKIINKLKSSELIIDETIPGDELYCWAYALTNKGRKYVEGYRKEDLKTLREISEDLLNK